MARKVFISVLGTGFYEECTYCTDGFSSSKTRFVQEAVLEMLTKDEDNKWTENDAAYILLTENAKKKNWQVEGNKRSKPKGEEEVEYIGLKTVLENKKYAFPINEVGIKDGKSESEIWDIFNSIYSRLEEDDELYFDVTHAFRYLPMFIIVLGHYAKFMKGTSVKAVVYGNYEARNDDKQEAPLMDLLPISLLQDWTSSAATFVETGRVKAFGAEVLALREDSALPRRINAYIQEFNRCLNEFEGQISTCRGTYIVKGEAACEANKNIKKIVNAEVLPQPIVEVLNTIQKAIGQYQENSLENLRQAIEWCKHYDLVQQGYTLCQESIVTFLCDKFSELNPYKDKGRRAYRDYRDFWSSILAVDNNVICDETRWGSKLTENRQLSRALFKLEWVGNFRREYGLLTGNRNQVNHAGFTGDVRADVIKRQFRSSVDACMKLFDEDLPAPVIEAPAEEKVFINLSNHPKDQWSAEQLDAAKQFGECLDMPFPQIDPNDDVNQIDAIAKEYIKKIMEYAVSKTVTVHIMGEMCFTYRMIKQLRALGIRCVCSTSYRIVRDEGNGKRYVEFHFKQFRDYEC